MIVGLIEALSLTDALLLLGLAGVSVKTALEMTGKTRSSKLLREDNRDLTARNKTLEEGKSEQTLALAESKANELKLLARIEALELKVRELESRDQGAVLHALAEHEVRAQGRADHSEERAAERHGEALVAWERIATAIEGGAS